MNRDKSLGILRRFVAEARKCEPGQSVSARLADHANQAIDCMSREPHVRALWYRQEQQEGLLQKMIFELGRLHQHIATGRPGKDSFTGGRAHLNKFLKNHIEAMRNHKRTEEGK